MKRFVRITAGAAAVLASGAALGVGLVALTAVASAAYAKARLLGLN